MDTNRALDESKISFFDSASTATVSNLIRGLPTASGGLVAGFAWVPLTSVWTSVVQMPRASPVPGVPVQVLGHRVKRILNLSSFIIMYSNIPCHNLLIYYYRSSSIIIYSVLSSVLINYPYHHLFLILYNTVSSFIILDRHLSSSIISNHLLVHFFFFFFFFCNANPPVTWSLLIPDPCISEYSLWLRVIPCHPHHKHLFCRSDKSINCQWNWTGSKSLNK